MVLEFGECELLLFDVDMKDLLVVLSDVMVWVKIFEYYYIIVEVLLICECMSLILDKFLEV